MPTPSAPTHRPHDLETRLRRLEDLEEIKRLKHRYTALVDDLIADPAAAQDFVDLYAPEFVATYDSYGTFSDKPALLAFLTDVISAGFDWGFHIAGNPRIDIDGDRATGHWYLSAEAVPAGSTTVVPFRGRYEDTYVRTADGWKISRSALKFDPPPTAVSAAAP